MNTHGESEGETHCVAMSRGENLTARISFSITRTLGVHVHARVCVCVCVLGNLIFPTSNKAPGRVTEIYNTHLPLQCFTDCLASSPQCSAIYICLFFICLAVIHFLESARFLRSGEELEIQRVEGRSSGMFSTEMYACVDIIQNF